MAAVAAAFCMLCLPAHADVPFVAAPDFPTNLQPWATVIGDFNNDGRADVAMANFDSPGYATVLLGNGHGSFAYQSAPAVEKVPNGLAAGDFDGDGKLDLVVSSISNDPADIVSVLRGRGDGSFGAAVTYAVGAMPQNVVVADFNNDGKPDILTENGNSNSISVLLGNGDGTFMPAVPYDLGLSPMNVAVGDIDGDGNLDVFVSANSPLASFAFLQGFGYGRFGVARYGGSGGALYYGIAVADLDRDGHLDVALLDTPGSKIDVYYGEGGGLFENVLEVPTDADFSSVAAADLFGDGHVELLTAGDSGVRLFESRRDGTFRDAGALPGVAGGANIAIADIDGNGSPDIVSPSYFTSQSTALLNQTILRGGFE